MTHPVEKHKTKTDSAGGGGMDMKKTLGMGYGFGQNNLLRHFLSPTTAEKSCDMSLATTAAVKGCKTKCKC